MQGEIIEDTPENFIHPLAEMSNKRSKGFAQLRRVLFEKKDWGMEVAFTLCSPTRLTHELKKKNYGKLYDKLANKT